MTNYLIVHWRGQTPGPFITSDSPAAAATELQTRGRFTNVTWEAGEAIGSYAFFSGSTRIATAVKHKFDERLFG